MSYQILKCRVPGQEALYVLKGGGPHEGTLANITEREFQEELSAARADARASGHRAAEFSLLMDSPKRQDGPEVMRVMHEFLDREFLRAHGERLARDNEAPTKGEYP